MMGAHKLHYMNSLLVHLCEDNKAIRDGAREEDIKDSKHKPDFFYEASGADILYTGTSTAL